MTDIGRAGMVMKGDYNSASTYETLDAVSYNNGLYVAKQNVPAGTVPTNTTYWQKAITITANAVNFLPVEGSTLDWGEFEIIGNVVMASFGFLVENITSGTAITLGTISKKPATSNLIVPVCDGYWTANYAGSIFFDTLTGEVKFNPAVTANKLRICGTVVYKTND